MSKSSRSLSKEKRMAEERLQREIQKSIDLLSEMNLEEIVDNMEFRKAMRSLNKEIKEHDDMLKAQANQTYGAIPKRRMRLAKSASKRKAMKTRSEYAKKKKVSHKTRKY